MSDEHRIPIVLPDLGAQDQPVGFAQWLVNEGDGVLELDRVAEVLVGGVLFHVTSPAEGTLLHAIDREGTLLRPGDVLGFIQES